VGTVCTVGYFVRANGQQVVQTDSWSLEKFWRVPSVICCLLLVQQGQKEGRLNVGLFTICAFYRLEFGT